MRKNFYKHRTSENLLTQLDKFTRHNRQGSYKTKERYYEAMKRYCDFVWLRFKLQKLANISGKHITAYVADMHERGLAASTVKTNLSAIRFWHAQIPKARKQVSLWLGHERDDVTRMYLASLPRMEVNHE